MDGWSEEGMEGRLRRRMDGGRDTWREWKMEKYVERGLHRGMDGR